MRKEDMNMKKSRRVVYEALESGKERRNSVNVLYSQKII